MIIYIFFLIFIFIGIYLWGKNKHKNYTEVQQIIKSLVRREFLTINNISDELKNDYNLAIKEIKKRDLELEKSMKETQEYRDELEITYETLISKSKELEESNKILTERVTRLSNINSLSKAVLSVIELDKIIETIFDAFFILTEVKKISLYLWEDGKLVNKKVKGNMDLEKEYIYDEERLSEFTRKDFRNIYNGILSEFIISENERCMAFPLNVKGKELGVIFIIESGVKLNAIEQETISALAIQVAIAINNSQIYSDLLVKERISQELNVASRIQKKILPKEIKNILGLDIATFFKPAKEIGGDYYDYTIMEDILNITIADVSGKGVPAAFLMAQGRSILRTLELQGNQPSYNLRKLNALMYNDITEDMFITMLHSSYCYKSKAFTYSNAGHTPLIVYNSSENRVEMHSVKGVALGFLEDYLYKEKSFMLNIGDIVLFYTDGITEAENKEKQLFGIERLKNIILKNSNLGSDEIKEIILKEVSVFQDGTEQNDDITFVVIKRVI